MMNCFSPVIRSAARKTGSACCFFIQPSHFLARQHADVRRRLSQLVGALVSAQHHRKQFTVVRLLEQSLPLTVRGIPDSVRLPTMQIAETVGTNVLCSKARHHGGGQPTLVLV